jgi:hypothetical protein
VENGDGLRIQQNQALPGKVSHCSTNALTETQKMSDENPDNHRLTISRNSQAGESVNWGKGDSHRYRMMLGMHRDTW